MTATSEHQSGASATRSVMLGEMLRACRREDLRARLKSDIRLRGLSEDSRRIAPEFLFAAFPGARQDGRDFIPDALRRGASAILTTRDTPPIAAREGGIPAWLGVAEPRILFAHMAANFYPRRPERVVAITGTNGKTSCAWFARGLWRALSLPSASIGTLGLHSDAPLPATDSQEDLTTPSAVALHRMLETLAASGIERVAMEASSHGLAQHRLEGLRFDAAAFTSFSQDHLDYHASMEEYAAAKLRLFAELLAPDATAVLNADMSLYAQVRAVAARHAGRVISVGQAESADIAIRRIEPREGGQRVFCVYEGREWEVALNLIGAFQASNALTAAALLIAEGHNAESVFPLLARLETVPGRLEEAGRLRNGARVYVDYAHTPDALAKVLDALRPHARGAIRVLFGCGGERDQGKRARMGAIAARKADAVIVTDDNPRREDAAAIRREILAACPHAVEIADRREAIRHGVSALRGGDILLVAGKGDERFHLYGEEKIPFHDVGEARDAIAAADGEAQ